MTKAELGDMILLLKGYSNQDAKLDVRLVWILADIALPKLIERKIKEDGEDVLDLFIKSEVLGVLEDNVRKKKYVELLNYPINISGKSIREVSATEGECDSFAIYKIGEQSIYCKLEAGNALGKPIATPEGKRVYLKNLPLLVDELLVKYIPKITSIDNEEEIPVPSDYELDLVDMIRTLVDEQKMTKEDKYNDGEQLD